MLFATVGEISKTVDVDFTNKFSIRGCVVLHVFYTRNYPDKNAKYKEKKSDALVGRVSICYILVKVNALNLFYNDFV
jgi:hypothetical protein